MKFIRSCFAMSLLLGAPAFAQSPSEGFSVAKMAFESIDANADGQVTAAEMTAFGESIFLGMDYDKDSKVTFDEFSDWDIGFGIAAENEGGPQAFTIANRILFGLWDLNNDGELTPDEFAKAGSLDFLRADANRDMALGSREYLLGYSVNIVMRGAIRPDIDVSKQ